jgi:phosphomannomutase
VTTLPTTDLDLVHRIRDWIAADPDPSTRAELEVLLERDASGELEARFGDELEFGTAGLRGALGAGPARMNRATVRRATAGLVRFLLEEVAGAAAAGVVIGHDARHGSAEFAEETARVITGAGVGR